MARYTTSVRTPLSPAEAFAYMADVTHFQEWDPGVKRAVRVLGDGKSVGTAYDLTVKAGGTTVMRYEVKNIVPPASVRDDFLSERAESPLDLAVDFRFFSVRAAELLRESDFFALAIFSGVADGSGVGAAFDSSV